MTSPTENPSLRVPVDDVLDRLADMVGQHAKAEALAATHAAILQTRADALSDELARTRTALALAQEAPPQEPPAAGTPTATAVDEGTKE